MSKRVDAQINREKFNELKGSMSAISLHNDLTEDGMSVEYPSFMNMIGNKSTWKLTYAMLLCKRLNVTVEDLFILHEE